MNSKKQFLLGLFFLSALSTLGFYTLFLTNFTLFGDQEQMDVHFPRANALREGDPVLLWGIRVGRVAGLDVDPLATEERRVRVTLNLEQPIELNEDYRIEIQDSSFLGGHQVYVDPGTPGGAAVQLATGEVILGHVQRNALQEIGSLVAGNRQSIDEIVASVGAILTDVRAGKGVIGRLIYDEGLADEIGASVSSFRAASADVAAITTQVRSGQGDLGRLIYDDLLYGKATALMDDLAVIADDLQAGKGLLGRLLRDDALADEVDRAVHSIANVAARLESGEGLVGRLLSDPQMAADGSAFLANLRQASDDIAAVAASLREGEGSLGKLMTDSELYDEALTGLKLLTRTLEDYREAAPISAFTGVLFSAF